MHRQSGSSTLAQLVHGSDAQQMLPAMLRDVHVDGVLCGPNGGAALRDQPANGAAPPSVPMLLLRDASLQQGADSIAHYVHSGLRGPFSGPAARLGAGAYTRWNILCPRLLDRDQCCAQNESLSHCLRNL